MSTVYTHGGEAARPPMSRRRAFGVLALIILLVEGVPLAYTFVVPALMEIAGHFQTTEVAWTLTVLTLSGAVFTPLVGKLGDMHGKKRCLLIAASLFVVGSVVCAVAPNFPIFLAGRAIQGAALPMLVLAYGLIRDLLPRDLVTTALGFVATGLGISAVAGPFVAGYLIDRFGYGGVFWFHAIYTAVLGSMLAIMLPESPIRAPGKLDVIGVLLLTIGATLLTLGVGESYAWGIGSTKSLAVIAAGLVLLVGWFCYQRVPSEPLVGLNLLAKPAMKWTLLGSFFLQFTLLSYPMLITMFAMTPPNAGLGYGWGLSALGVSQISGFTGITAVIAGPLAGWYCRRGNPELMLVLGGFSMMVGCAMFATAHASTGMAMLSSAIFGIGGGAGSAALSNLIVRHSPASSQGIAGSMMNEIGLIGAAVGTQITLVVLSLPGVIKVRDASMYHEAGHVHAFWALAISASMAGLAGLAVRSFNGAKRFSGAPSGATRRNSAPTEVVSEV
ncbi:MFS transporter [Mycolicibacterium sp. 050232]|uniref:MFS transporter n=1 Tax=Mycolicibacterium sp. 050232 TaxID=3113982 RepID=UPI002E298CD8|nr:MFS transporter [Mycolicibacterium sp. 050232]MED5811010.1 MFS transporter [Mycolicibacterium sp. 050232]